MLTMNSCLPVILIAVAVASPCAAADDDTRLFDAPRLTAEQVRRIVADRTAKPRFPNGMPSSWRDERAALLQVGAPAAIVARVRREADDNWGGVVPAALACATSADVRGIAHRFADLLNLTALESLSAAVAAELAAADSATVIGLGGVRGINADAADALGTFGGMLMLNGLGTLSVEAAERLAARRQGSLALPARVVSPPVAVAFARRQGPLVIIDGGALSSAAATSLAASDQQFGLVGAAGLSPEVAAAIKGAKGDVVILGCSGLGPEAARQLAARDGRRTVVIGLAGLSAEVAGILAASDCHVIWSDLRECSRELAAALVAKHPGLELPLVTEVSAEAARELGRCSEFLVIGVSSLTPELGAIFAGCPGRLDLCGVETLTPQIVDALMERRGSLAFSGLASLEPDVAAALSRCVADVLELDGLTSLSPEAAAALAHSDASFLSLDGLTSLEPEVAASLGDRSGCLYLRGLSTLSTDVAAGLAACDYLALNGGIRLTPDAAAALGGGGNQVVFVGSMQELTPEVAIGLAGCRLLRFDPAPPAVNPRVAEILAGVAGCEFVLPFLEALTPEIAQRFAERRDDVVLAGIRTLVSADATEIARILATKRGGLALPDLARITPGALQILVEKNDVQLPDAGTLEIVASADGDDVIVPRR
jgi:hypothetical protein